MKNVRIRINAVPNLKESAVGHTNSQPRRVSGEIFQAGVSRLLDIIGVNDDKTVSGLPWTIFSDHFPGFRDKEFCSEKCFWQKANRLELVSSRWLPAEVELFDALMPAYTGSRRGPCFLAFTIEKPCVEVCILPFLP